MQCLGDFVTRHFSIAPAFEIDIGEGFVWLEHDECTDRFAPSIVFDADNSDLCDVVMG